MRHTILKKVIVALITFTLTFLLVLGYGFTRPSKYTATAKLLASYGGGINTSSPSDAASGMSYVQAQLKNYPQLAKTEVVLEPVIKELSLPMDATQLASMVTLNNPDGTLLLNITVNAGSGQQAADIANTLAEHFVENPQGPQSSTDQLPTQLTLVQKAIAPTKPSTPSIYVYIIVAIGLGFAASIFALYLTQQSSRKVTDAEEVKELIAAPLLGELSIANTRNSAQRRLGIDPASRENYQYIKANITSLAHMTNSFSVSGRTLVVCPLQQSEDATTVAINIATAIASEKMRVLLVDTDLKHPQLHYRLNLMNQVGFSELLNNQANIAEAIHPTKIEYLSILTAGGSLHASEIATNSIRLQEILKIIKFDYDYVIFYSPTPAQDKNTLLLGNFADGYILITDTNTHKKDLIAATAEIQTTGTPIIGFIFSQFSRQPSSKKRKLPSHSREGVLANTVTTDEHLEPVQRLTLNQPNEPTYNLPTNNLDPDVLIVETVDTHQPENLSNPLENNETIEVSETVSPEEPLQTLSTTSSVEPDNTDEKSESLSSDDSVESSEPNQGIKQEATVFTVEPDQVEQSDKPEEETVVGETNKSGKPTEQDRQNEPEEPGQPGKALVTTESHQTDEPVEDVQQAESNNNDESTTTENN